MHFVDLDPCRYREGEFDARNWHAPLLAVGWLEHPHPFRRGPVQEDLLPRLVTMCGQASDLSAARAFGGLHVCSICKAEGARLAASPIPMSHTNLFVPGDGVVYLAPGGIVHYIEEHSYAPPEPFVRAVRACPDLRSENYHRALRSANDGFPPPR